MTIYRARFLQNLPASYYKPIGQILARWTFTDIYIQSIIWHCFKIKSVKAARLLTVGRNASDILKLFSSLVPIWISDPADAKELKDIHDAADDIRAYRNKFVHGYWGYRVGQRNRIRLFYLRENDLKIMPHSVFVTIDELRKRAADLDALNRRLKRFHKHLGAPIP